MELQNIVGDAFQSCDGMNQPAAFITNDEVAVFKRADVGEFIRVGLPDPVALPKSNKRFLVILLNRNSRVCLKEARIEVCSSANNLVGTVICNIRCSDSVVTTVLATNVHGHF